MDKNISEQMKQITLWGELKRIFPSLLYSPAGSSTLEVPDFHRKNLKEIAENLPSKGFQYNINCYELKISIKKYLPKHLLEREFSEKDILVAPGAVKAIHLILLTFLDFESDEIIFFHPFYICHSTDLLWRGFKNIILANRNMEDFSIDFEDLESKLNSRTKFLVIVNPDNPTTHFHSEIELNKLSDLLANFPRVIVIEDLAYFAYLANDIKLKSFSAIGKNKDKTFSVFSGGKLFNATGLRCGWAIGPEQLIRDVQKSLEMNFCLTSPIESICIAKNLESSLKAYEGMQDFYEWVKNDQNRRFEYVLNFLKDYSLKAFQPDGTYYVIIDVSCYRHKLPERFFYTLDEPKVFKNNLDMAFCRMLIEEKIGLLPLSSFCEIDYKIDYLIRISCNRSFNDLNLLRDALIKLKMNGVIF